MRFVQMFPIPNVANSKCCQCSAASASHWRKAKIFLAGQPIPVIVMYVRAIVPCPWLVPSGGTPHLPHIPRISPRLRDPFVVRMLTASLALVLFGCAKTPSGPPEAPPRQATRVPSSQEFEELQRRHVAPPPAYGNKVVLLDIDSVPQVDLSSRKDRQLP
jgi:hypothetical protein